MPLPSIIRIAADEWSRTTLGANENMHWLNSNAGAVQAIMAVVIAILTYSLYRTTSKYTVLTSRIASVTEKQLSASMQPILEIKTAHYAIGTGTDGDSTSVRVTVSNVGDKPLKVVAINAVAFWKGERVGQGNMDSARNLVLMPGKNIEDWVTIYVSREVNKSECHVLVGVDCTDLAGVSEHSFSLDKEGKIRHFLGFERL